MLIIEMAKIELIGGYIGFMLIIEMAKTESTGGHIEIMLVIDDNQDKINRRPSWHYANYRDGQNRISWWPY